MLDVNHALAKTHWILARRAIGIASPMIVIAAGCTAAVAIPMIARETIRWITVCETLDASHPTTNNPMPRK